MGPKGVSVYVYFETRSKCVTKGKIQRFEKYLIQNEIAVLLFISFCSQKFKGM